MPGDINQADPAPDERSAPTDFAALRRAVRAPLRRWWLRVGIWWVLVWAIMRYFSVDTQSWLDLVAILPRWRWLGALFWYATPLMQQADMILVALGMFHAWITWSGLQTFASQAGIAARQLPRRVVFRLCMQAYLPLVGLMLLSGCLAAIIAAAAGKFIDPFGIASGNLESASQLLFALSTYFTLFVPPALMMIVLPVLIIASGKARFSIVLFLAYIAASLADFLFSWTGWRVQVGGTGQVTYTHISLAGILGILLGIAVLVCTAFSWMRMLKLLLAYLTLGQLMPVISEIPATGWAFRVPHFAGKTISVLGSSTVFLKVAPFTMHQTYTSQSGLNIPIFYVGAFYGTFGFELPAGWLAIFVVLALNILWLLSWWALARNIAFGRWTERITA